MRILISLFVVHIFFRVFNISQRLGFGHDEDLGGWIVKDLLVNHHFRLIGQQTSIENLFVGPLFYYLQAVFYALAGLDPVGGFYLVFILSIGTFFSFYFVFSKLFGRLHAFISCAIYASSLVAAQFDHWVVPSQPTILWSVWLFYVCISLTRGNLKVLPLLGLLVGLIWHIHVALAPLLLLVPFSLAISSKKVLQKSFRWRYLMLSLILFGLMNLPLLIFEVKHNFLQTKGLVEAAMISRSETREMNRIGKVIDILSLSTVQSFYNNPAVFEPNRLFFKLIFSTLAIVFWVSVVRTDKKTGWILLAWIGVVIFGQLISKQAISEYYFTNLVIIYYFLLANFLAKIYTTDQIGKSLVVGSIGIYILFNFWLVSSMPADHEGYLVRKWLVQQISLDVANNSYKCIAINYITSPGKESGYRYFFWLNNLRIITSGNDVPVYSIVNPLSVSSNEIEIKRGSIGIILPKNFYIDHEACSDPNRRIEEPLGFTK